MGISLSSTISRKSGKTIAPDCFHCGLKCVTGTFKFAEKDFCCQGCVSVFELLNLEGLQCYYDYESHPGNKRSAEIETERFRYLDDIAFQNKIFDFKQENIAGITFKINQIHCASCVWLLENVHKLNQGVLTARVNFLNKTMRVSFDLEKISLSDLVVLLYKIGYEPEIVNRDPQVENNFYQENKKLLMQTGVAGFCFGNVMMLSFPEYLSDDIPLGYSYFFAVCTLIVALPALFFSGQIWFKGAYHSLKQKAISMDLPIALGISVLFFVSCINIFYFQKIGYFDSLCAFIFFLLLARLFQSKTFHSLSFDHDISHFFPLYAMVEKSGVLVSTPLSGVQKGDRVFVRHGEVLSTGGKLGAEKTLVDYSFITGESEPVQVLKGNSVSIGGRIVGEPATIEVEQIATKAILNSFWSSSANPKKIALSRTLNEKISPYFVAIVVLISLLGFLYSYINTHNLINSLMILGCVFIVTCPCALAISAPLVQGLLVRYLSNYGVYIKDGKAIEIAADISDIVFDKTGTLTQPQKQISVIYENLTEEQKTAIVSVTRGSMHPVSVALSNRFQADHTLKIDNFREFVGKGVSANVEGQFIQVGQFKWLQNEIKQKQINEITQKDSTVILADGVLVGAYQFHEELRKFSESLLVDLSKRFHLSLISGDHKESIMQNIAVKASVKEAKFKLSPQEKANYINEQREVGKRVLMVGDGLNDTGALSASDIGVAILEEKMNFCPASDVIIEGQKLASLGLFLRASRFGKRLIKMNMSISLLYNSFGIFIALTGVLTPLWAAVLMPVSSLSVLFFSVVGVQWFAKQKVPVQQEPITKVVIG